MMPPAVEITPVIPTNQKESVNGKTAAAVNVSIPSAPVSSETYESESSNAGVVEYESIWPGAHEAKLTYSPQFELESRPIDEFRSLRVAVIGAGLAGVTAGILLPAKVPNINLTIFDKNADVGGTWFENIYPGVRCDIPANIYQSTFSPNTQWSEEYAQGAEILGYWKSLAKKYDVYKYLKLKHKITGAVWDEQKSKWSLGVDNIEKGEQFSEEFDVVITAIGRFNAWRLPNYPGIKDFKGHIRHSSNWDPEFDPKDKVVAVIGNGASGIQVVPNIQPLVKHLDHYARNPTWIAGSFGGEGEGRKLEPIFYPPELLQSFSDDETYYKFRKTLESKFYLRFGSIFKNSDTNVQQREDYINLMAERLKKKPELLDHLVPDFSPWCRRLTPGPGYLEALTADNVTLIRDPISHFTTDSIVTKKGTARKIDAVICSTGANINMHPPFPITAHGQTLQEAWSPDPLTYLGLATPGFPNMLVIQGPNAAGPAGTVPNQIETQATYIAKLLRKVSNQSIVSFAPSQEATDDFIAYCDSFFPRTVFSEQCSSWANGGRPGGRIHGHWPGSASHVNWVRREPRWEDWEWKTGGKNRFAWFGDGWTGKERSGDGDLTSYLRKPGDVDLRSYHEEWFQGVEY